MKHVTALGLAGVLAFALAAAACGSSTTAPTINPPSITETFTGTVDVGATNTHTFVLTKPGEIDATMNSESTLVNGAPTAVTIALGLDLGVWDGTTCGTAFTNTAKAGTTLSQAANTAATYCIKVYDIGNITPGSPVTYNITVAHP